MGNVKINTAHCTWKLSLRRIEEWLVYILINKQIHWLNVAFKITCANIFPGEKENCKNCQGVTWGDHSKKSAITGWTLG